MVGLTEAASMDRWTAERLWAFRLRFSNNQIDCQTASAADSNRSIGRRLA
jgi:hypothetical protein